MGGDRVQAALARLPLAPREVVVLSFLNDLSHQEISEVLGIPVGTVKSRLHHARATLRGRRTTNGLSCPAIHVGIPPPPGPEIVRAALARAARDRVEAPAPAPPRPYRAWALLTMEARLLHPALWLASALVMVAGVGFTLVRSGAAESVLALAVPLIAAAGVAGSYGPEQDTAFELVAVTPTSPRRACWPGRPWFRVRPGPGAGRLGGAGPAGRDRPRD